METRRTAEAGVSGKRVATIAGVEIDLDHVEEVLLSHGAVLETEVSTVEDDDRGELLNAVITLKGGYHVSNDLKTEIAWHVGTDIGYPSIFKDIEFIAKEVEPVVPWDEAREEGDVVFTSGHKIDITEVERVLMRYDDVTKAVVTGVPDDRHGEILKAYVTLKEGSVPTDDLKRDLAWYAQVEIGPMLLFEDIEFGERSSNVSITAPVGKDGMVVVDEVGTDGGIMQISGHRLSTTEVTNVLLSHPDISDAAVVTVPDERKGEVMKAFAKVKEGVVPSNDLKLELAWLVLTELKPIGVFKSIELEQAETEKTPYMGEEVRISGHTLLSIDVEEALVSHPSVAEAIVVGVPDTTHGEALQAFVNLQPDVLPTEALKEELAWHARTEIGPEVVFRSVKFRSFLPRAKDRKTLRSILRADALEIPTQMSITVAD